MSIGSSPTWWNEVIVLVAKSQTLLRHKATTQRANANPHTPGAFVWRRPDPPSGRLTYLPSSRRDKADRLLPWSSPPPSAFPKLFSVCRLSGRKPVVTWEGWKLEPLEGGEVKPWVIRVSPDPWEDPAWLGKGSLLTVWLPLPPLSSSRESLRHLRARW